MDQISELVAAPFRGPLDMVAFLVYVLAFPVYHHIYPWFVRRRPDRTAKGRIDAYRSSWIASVVRNRAVVEGAQQTRNTTMVASFLASSALILLGVTANIMLQAEEKVSSIPFRRLAWQEDPDAFRAKLILIMVVLCFSFMFFMGALRRIGHFNLILGADPDLVERTEGMSAIDYFSRLLNGATDRYTLATRSFYSALPLFLWLFSSLLFLGFTVISFVRFVCFTDFIWGRRDGND